MSYQTPLRYVFVARTITQITLPSVQPEIPQGSIMIFLKHFDTSKQQLFGAGKVYMQRNSKVSDLFTLINERMRWTPGTPLKLYEASPIILE